MEPAPKLQVLSVVFSGGTAITIQPGDVVVIVGPNNAGKSAALRGVRDKIQNFKNPSTVIKDVTLQQTGTPEEVITWLGETGRRNATDPSNPNYSNLGVTIYSNTALHAWRNPGNGLGELASWFCRLLSADSRIAGADPVQRISFTQEAPSHPIHLLERNDQLEKKLSGYFKKAFGTDLVVHRGAGRIVPLMVGACPVPKAGQDRVSFEFIQELEKLPRLETQGDGMRSFTGVLLNTFLGGESVVLIDEPEAFLHPPQARLLGKMLVVEKKTHRQFIVATHSTDILRGMLSAPSGSVHVVRITRDHDVNAVHSLDNTKIKSLWSDPLLRYSNILDGLFHERVILCESDSDCRFYSAVADAVIETKGEDYRSPDLMYTHCGGKARMPMVIRSLRQVNVPVTVVTDFDTLNDENPLHEMISAAGGDWANFVSDWKLVKSSVDAKKPELGSQEVVNEITAILRKIDQTPFPKQSRGEIEKILKRSSPWSIAKATGKAYVPSGDASAALLGLLNNLKTLGIFIIEDGELESFVKTVGGHGPAWANEVLSRDLKNDPELQRARDFVSQFAV